MRAQEKIFFQTKSSLIDVLNDCLSAGLISQIDHEDLLAALDHESTSLGNLFRLLDGWSDKLNQNAFQRTPKQESTDGERCYSHSHDDPMAAPQPNFLVSNIGTSIEEEIRFTVYDGKVKNLTGYIPFRRAKIAIKTLRSIGLKVVGYDRRELTCDLFRVNGQPIQRELVSVTYS